MASITQTISEMEMVPSRDDPDNFGIAGNYAMAYISSMADEYNAFKEQMNVVSSDITSKYNTITANTNFKGSWSDLTGACTVPASVYHDEKFWMLLSDLADITAKEPGVDTEWTEIFLSVNIAGGATETSTAVDITLTSDSTVVQAVTPTAENLCVSLPNATTLNEGINFHISNDSSEYDLFIKDNAGDLLYKIEAGETTPALLLDNSTSAGGWRFETIPEGLVWLIGTAVVFEEGNTQYISTAMIDSTHAIVCYQDYTNASKGTACILTIDGTSITPGTAVVFEEENTQDISTAMMASDKPIVCYRNVDVSNYGMARIIQ